MIFYVHLKVIYLKVTYLGKLHCFIQACYMDPLTACFSGFIVYVLLCNQDFLGVNIVLQCIAWSALTSLLAILLIYV